MTFRKIFSENTLSECFSRRYDTQVVEKRILALKWILSLQSDHKTNKCMETYIAKDSISWCYLIWKFCLSNENRSLYSKNGLRCSWFNSVLLHVIQQFFVNYDYSFDMVDLIAVICYYCAWFNCSFYAMIANFILRLPTNWFHKYCLSLWCFGNIFWTILFLWVHICHGAIQTNHTIATMSIWWLEL